MNNELQRALGRQQWLIDAHDETDPNTTVTRNAAGQIEVIARLANRELEIVLRDMTGGPAGWTTVLLRNTRASAADLEKAHLDDEQSVKAFLRFLYCGTLLC
jgi:hypothetical protein